MSKEYSSKAALPLVILLLLTLLPLSTIFVLSEAPTIETDKALYAIKWLTVTTDEGEKPVPMGYVEVLVSFSGLTTTKRYRLEVSKKYPPAGIVTTYAKDIYGASQGTLNFTLPPAKNAHPYDISGTWIAALYDAATGKLLKNCTFGVWAINSPVLNYHRSLMIWGGGAEPNSTVPITVDDITEVLFGESPAICSVDGTYGVFENGSAPIPDTVEPGEYAVTIEDYTPIDQPGKPIDDTLTFTITNELLVTIISPEDESTWYRTETIPLEVEVLYQDYEPVTAGSVNVTLTAADGTEVEVPLAFSPATNTWKGLYKIYPCNATGDWDVFAYAEDGYGNWGEDEVSITVEPAILVVSSVSGPQPVVPRTTWARWQIKVTYKGDGSPVTNLDVIRSIAYVVNATTGARVAPATITRVTNGIYDVTWFVPPDAKLGSYRFLIPAWALIDACNNTGPEANVLSAPFTVGITALNVTVETYDTLYDRRAVRKSFVPGEDVYIGANIIYADSGVVMSVGYATATISNETWSTEVSLTFHTGTRMWWGWLSGDDTAGMTAGRYDVTVLAYDLGNNTGVGTTYFLLAGFIITPYEGTVPPEEKLTEAKVDGAYLITAGIFVDPVSGKKLGTLVTIKGVGFTPNSKVNVTVEGLPYPAVDLGYDILVLMNVPVDAEGAFTASFAFPTAPSGTYDITATDAEGVSWSTTFTVIPGLILTPGEIVGSGLIKVIATGYPAEAYGIALLVDGTDALFPTTWQVEDWITNANGTLTSYTIEDLFSVKPAFVLPFIEPGTYEITLYMGTWGEEDEFVCESASDTVKVVNDIKEISAVVKGFEAVKTLLSQVSASIESIDDEIAVLKTNVGYVKVGVDDLAKALSSLNAAVTEVKNGVATITTDVGTIKTKVALLDQIMSAVSDAKSAASDAKTAASDAKSAASNAVSAASDAKSAAEGAKSAADAASAAIAGLSTTVWIAVILSLIAAIVSIIVLIQVSRKIAG